MTKSHWDKRFDTESYVYGTEVNDFFKHEIQKLNPGYLLDLGAGEGRNAVYAACLGWDVVAVDQSKVAQQKTMRLAKSHNVQLQYHLLDINHFDFDDNAFDAVGMIFLHLPPDIRKTIHNELYRTLKPGGTLIMEAFDKSQLKYGTGGPKNPDMLYSTEDLKRDFMHFSRLSITHKLRTINEGKHHVGEASVIQVKAVK